METKQCQDDRPQAGYYLRINATAHSKDLPQRIGRPRRGGPPVTSDPTNDILAAAGRLFGELGMAGTTMARIAVEVGLQQSSIYYYFRNREEIAVALVEQANVVPLELIDRIIAEGGSPPQMLHAFVRGDVAALCRLPFDINDIHRIAARDRDRFAVYWQERALLERKLSSIVRNGIDSGLFVRVKPRLAALTIMANDEGLQNWFRLTSRANADESTRFLADVTVRGLLAPGFELVDLIDNKV